MTYQELKTKVVNESFRSLWKCSDDEARRSIATQLQRYGGLHTIKMLTDVDKSFCTSAKELVEALQRYGFPQEKLTVIDENKAQIELDGHPCTITSNQLGHSFLYDNNNTRRFLDFIHTPADIVAEYLVERYCSDNWLEEEVQRRMILFKEFQAREKEIERLREKYHEIMDQLEDAILKEKKFERLHKKFFEMGRDYYNYLDPDTSAIATDEKVSLKWDETVRRSTEELKRLKRSKAARERYEKVTKPKLQAKKQAEIEEKRALLQEYKQKYRVKCRFIHVRGYYNAANLFVVPAIKDQVVSFNVPDKFNREDYDRAMKLVMLLNELTEKYGKTKVQKKGALPKEANDSLLSTIEELSLGRMWNGIFNESQRHYLHEKYKDSIEIR